MKHLPSVCVLALVCGTVTAEPTIEYLPIGFLVTDLSEDGSVAVGNVQGDGSYETFRWTEESGVERLGRGSVATLGIGGGSPDVSYDGNYVSASIASTDDHLTLGRWSATGGWEEAFPPVPAEVTSVDNAYASAWGLSGDGTTVTGYYYSSVNHRAQACKWLVGNSLIALPQIPGRSARVDAANFDGSVVCGWEESATGPRLPTAWRQGTKFRLEDSPQGSQAAGVNGNGDVVVGGCVDPSIATRVAAIWTWNGSSYELQRIGMLPGSVQTLANVFLSSISDDAQIAVGVNYYTNNPGGNADGIVWTPQGGLINATAYLASLGLSVPATMDIRDMTCVSPDGRVVAGLGMIVENNIFMGFQSFIVRVPPPACPGDTNADNMVDSADLSVLLSQFGQDVTVGTGADFNDDGVVNSADLSVLLSSFGTAC